MHAKVAIKNLKNLWQLPHHLVSFSALFPHELFGI